MKKINENEIEVNNVRYVREDEVVKGDCKGCCFEGDVLCHELSNKGINNCSKNGNIWVRKKYSIEDLKTQMIIIEDLTESQFDSLKQATERLGKYYTGEGNYDLYHRFNVDDLNGYIQHSGKEFYTKQGYIVARFEDISIEDNSFKIINENEIVIDGVSYVTEENKGCKECCFGIDTKECKCFGNSKLCSSLSRNDKRSITWKLKKENKMNPKYKAITSLSCSSVAKENPCQNEFEKFNSKFSPDGFFAVIDWDENEEFIIKQNGWISWLLDKNFIEEVEEEIEYDSEKVYIYKGFGGKVEFKLHYLDDKYFWVNLNNSDCIANRIYDTAIEALKYANETTGYKVYETMSEYYRS